MLEGARQALARWPPAYRFAHRARLLLRYRRGVPHEPDFAAFRHFTSRRGLFLDIGGNIGQSAASFRLFHKTAPILSIEANPAVASDLRFVGRLVRRHSYRICAASDRSGSVTLHVPVYRSLALTGEGSISPSLAERPYWTREQNISAAAADMSVMSVEAEAVRLDELGLAPAFVKVDVEGAEFTVLEGLADTLDTHRPILLIESCEVERLTEFLGARRYRPYLYSSSEDRFIPYRAESAQNLFFFHADDPFRQSVDAEIRPVKPN